MRRKGKLRKLVAVQFLSNISLDGSNGTAHYDYLSGYQHGDPYSRKTVTQNRTVFIAESADKNISKMWRMSPGCNQAADVGSTDFRSKQSVLNSVDTCLFSEAVSTQSIRRIDGCRLNGSTKNVVATAIIPSSIHPPTPKQPRNGAYRDSNLKSVIFQTVPSGLAGKRFAICSTGFRRTILTVFSVLSHNRKSTVCALKPAPRFSRSTASTGRNYNEGDALGPHSLIKPVVHHAASPDDSIDFGDYGPSFTDANDIIPLSSLPPTDDETISFARFLHNRPCTWISSSSATASMPPFRFYGPGLEPDLLAPIGLEPFSSEQPSVIASVFRFNNPRSFVPSRRTLLWPPSSASFVASSRHRARRRNSSSASGGCGASATSINSTTISYPDPLFYYSPCLLDDPDLLVATGRRLFQLPCYLVSVLTYVRPNEQKRNVNREFHERFPMIQLTLTKLRSIKSVLVHIVFRLGLDLWIAAHAHVLFEKLTLKLYVNKSNRRLCASAALLISAKLNDVKGLDLINIMQELEANFRISRRDLLRAELEVSLGLEFCLIPTEAECAPHYFRIYKLLDLTPPYPISFLGNAGSLHSLHNEPL